ncbi:hypothetical protein HanIR_Chr04g0164271 [Helianthus annuus]|nr:hypothetical protein HanIR_Chr04g0164271 [Helianthus annuus]
MIVYRILTGHNIEVVSCFAFSQSEGASFSSTTISPVVIVVVLIPASAAAISLVQLRAIPLKMSIATLVACSGNSQLLLILVLLRLNFALTILSGMTLFATPLKTSTNTLSIVMKVILVALGFVA